MRISTTTPAALLLSFLAPSLVVSSWWDGGRANQLAFDTPSSQTSGSLFRQGAAPPHAARPNPSVVVRVVDPAFPSTSSVVTPSSLAADSSDINEDDDEELDDAPNFGRACTFASTFETCGDFMDESTGLDHGLFCSPSTGTCGGRGAACGATEACDGGLMCNLSSHRCVSATAELLSIESKRNASRRKSAAAACPDGARVCSSDFGSSCVFTSHDDQQCGGCLGFGGVDCSAIVNALATSCRSGGCLVHACVHGYRPTEEGDACVDDLLLA